MYNLLIENVVSRIKIANIIFSTERWNYDFYFSYSKGYKDRDFIYFFASRFMHFTC